MKFCVAAVLLLLIGIANCQISLSASGDSSQCPLDPSCGGVSDPVCGTDGVTYRNLCELNQAQCKYLALGKLIDAEHTGPCLKTTDGTLLTKLPPAAHTGVDCPASCDGSTEKYPLCGSDGITYQNKCYFMQAMCSYKQKGIYFDLAYAAACKDSSVTGTTVPVKPLVSDTCTVTCDATPDFTVCGSDGVTYANKCLFYQAKCRYRLMGKTLDVINRGGCGSSSTSHTGNPCVDMTHCDRTSFSPVCASDGTKYANKCDFLRAQCKYRQNGRQLQPVRCGGSLVG